MRSSILVALGLAGAAQAGLYLKTSPVLQVDGKSYEKLIAKSNYTSVGIFISDATL
jgi:protein disulfide-isomerase A6